MKNRDRTISVMSSAMSTLIYLAALPLASSQFTGHKVLRIDVNSTQAAGLAAIAGIGGLDFWDEPAPTLPTTMDVRVPASSLSRVTEAVAEHGLHATELISDVQSLLDAPSARSVGASFTQGYHDYDAIVAWLTSLASSHATLASTTVIGQSHENRDLVVLRVTAPGDASARKKLFWMTLLHAREWLTGATACWMAERLLAQYGSDAAVTRLLDTYELHFLVVANPDGFEFTHTGERFWRKTRKPVGGGCVGTDPNRNFAHSAWNTVGVSSDPCSEIYPGPSAASEPEIRAIQQYVAAGGFDIFLDSHAYSQMFLTPWGYTTAPTSDEARLHIRKVRRHERGGAITRLWIIMSRRVGYRRSS